MSNLLAWARRGLWALCFGIAALGLGAASPVTISFYTYNYSAQQKKGVDQLISEFEAANPDVKIELVFVPSNEINSKIQADIAAGISPDVIQVVFDALDYSVRNFGVQDLGKIVPAAELNAHLAGYEKAALDVARLNGKLWGLPYTFSTPVLFYNAKLFKDAGLDADQPPTTWKQVGECARKIIDKTGNSGFIFGGYSGNFDWLVQGLLKSNGGGVMDAKRGKITFGEKNSAEAVAMLAKMVKDGLHANMTEATGFDAMAQGKLGMILTTSAYQAYLLSSAKAAGWELRTGKMPTFEDKPAVPVNSGSGVFVCSRDKAKQQGAWKFIKFITSERGYTIITTMMGYPPLRPGIVNDDRYLKQWATENPLVKANLEQLKIVSQWQSYPGNNYQQIESILMDAVNKAVFSSQDAMAIMMDAQKRAQSLMPK